MTGSRLREVVRATATRAPAAEEERCELCGAPIPPEHRHLVDLQTRAMLCACQACKILFDKGAAGGGHYRLVPERRLSLDDFEMDDATWSDLQVPVDMAFFFRSSAVDRVVAFYPGPAGATESTLELASWERLEAANPVLATLAPDVEALLVNRARGARLHFLVPIEDPYRLVALIRTRWRGLTGGGDVWQGIEDFFDDLAGRTRTASNRREEAAWQST
ncbi:MAG: hypothetical protein QOJ07_1211 [Thermoleophilaceae bacterium]|jgi:hypothetical protein|nr:hypothetical protein [Thermoleophilaceae bacterium]